VLGWAAEIAWTAAYELACGTRKHPTDPRVRVPMTPPERWRLAGHTYLWVWFCLGLVMERLHDALTGRG